MNAVFFVIITLGWLPNIALGKNKGCKPQNPVISAIEEYSNRMKNEKNIKLTMYGVNYAGEDKIYDGKVHLVDIGYRIDKNMKFVEARKFFYSLVDGLLESLNKDESLKQYFYRYPISYQDLYFRLSFDYDGKSHLKKDDIDMIAILENEIMYFIVEDEIASGEFKTKKLTPDVQVITGHFPKTRCITKKLPEIDK